MSYRVPYGRGRMVRGTAYDILAYRDLKKGRRQFQGYLVKKCPHVFNDDFLSSASLSLFSPSPFFLLFFSVTCAMVFSRQKR